LYYPFLFRAILLDLWRGACRSAPQTQRIEKLRVCYTFFMIDVPAYLSRIGYKGPVDSTAATLSALQRAHLLAVPFENLDIALGRPIHLETSHLFHKIVTRRRGGYCFEVNGLFALLLEHLGFHVLRLSASSANDDGTYLAEFEHLALQVHAVDDPETAWLVDVGWGDGPIEPLRLLEPGEQERGGRIYHLRWETCFLVLEEKQAGGEWLKHYRFNLAAHELNDFEAMNQYMQTSPESLFTKKRLCTLFRLDGRITLSDLRWIVTHNHGLRGREEKEERSLSGEDEVRQILRDEFGIDLD
jgi:N-hydroxyarylamine O-acetyltransferase